MEKITFEEMNKQFQKVMNYEEMEIQSKTIIYNNKIADNIDSIEALKNLFSLKGVKSLVTAPANAGKTYTIAETFTKSFSNTGIKFPKYLNILVTPNRVQSLQNDKTYNLTSIVGGSNPMSSYNLFNKNSFSILPDKAREVIHFINTLSKKIHINLCIDESHDLIIESREYRKDAIGNLDELIQTVQERRGSVVMMTATPDALLGELFNCYLHFKPKDNYKLADTFNFVKCDPEKKFKDELFNFILSKMESGKIPFVRLNDIQLIDELQERLARKGLITTSIDSTKKKSNKYYDVTKGDIDDFYVNPIFENVIKKSQLPRTIMIAGNKENIKAYFTTSMIEVGTNICSIEGEEDKNLLPIFVCQNSKDAKYTSIIQFLNRIRYKIDECAVFIKDRQPTEMKFLIENNLEPTFRNILTVCEKEYSEARRIQVDFKDSFNSIKPSLIPNKHLNEFMDTVLKLCTITDEANDGECLSYNHKTKNVVLDTLRFRQLCFQRYMYQFYYFQKEFIEILEERTFMKITTINLNGNDDIKKDDNHHEDKCEKSFENKKVFLKQIAASKDGVNALLKCMNELKTIEISAVDVKITNGNPEMVFTKEEIGYVSEIRQFLNSKEGNMLTKMIKTGTEPRKALEMVANCKESEINKLYINEIKDNCLGTLDKNMQRALIKYVLDEVGIKELSEFIGVDKATKIFEICDYGYKTAIRKALRVNIPIEDIIKTIMSNTTKKALNDMILKKQYHEYNMQFINGDRNLMFGLTGFEQSIVLQLLYSTNENGNTTQKTLSKKLLSVVANELTKARILKFRYKKYTISDVITLCSGIFHLRKKNGTYAIVDLV